MTETPAPATSRGQHAWRSVGAPWSRAAVAGLVVVGLVLVLRTTVVGPLRVDSASMEPTLRAGDVVLVTRWGPDPEELQRGNLVVFEDPGQQRLALKRVVGLPHESVVVRDGVLFVDDERVREPWVDHALIDGYYSRTYRVPPGSVFVMGDNRGNWVDFRDYGSIGSAELRGTMVMRLWPLDRD